MGNEKVISESRNKANVCTEYQLIDNQKYMDCVWEGREQRGMTPLPQFKQQKVTLIQTTNQISSVTFSAAAKQQNIIGIYGES